ncbi:MAG TPA: RHS repeat domain-containing protein, partial [Candidatus Methylacidiphilales bacterium]
MRELLQTTDPQGRTTKYGWCVCGALSTLTDANGNVTTWNHDLEGRVTSKVYADGSQIVYRYETSTSRLHNMTDARGDTALYAYQPDTPASTLPRLASHSFSRRSASLRSLVRREC